MSHSRVKFAFSCRCDQLGEELEAERLAVEIWRSDHQQRRLCEAGQTEWTAGGGLGKYGPTESELLIKLQRTEINPLFAL